MRSLLFLSVLLIPLASYATTPDNQFPVEPPPLNEDYYPCMENCHKDMKPNRQHRVLSEHQDIKLSHAEDVRWCLDCHDADDRDSLHLQSGEKIGFDVSYRLCGQCHGDKYRDWKIGIHGKRTGMWNGKKTYLLCAHCHNPHNPRYKLTEDKEHFPGVKGAKPLPPPQVPGKKSNKSH